MIPVAPGEYTAIINSPCGCLGIHDENDTLRAINFLYEGARARKPRTSLSREVARQLQEFFKDAGFRFDLPLAAAPTPHQFKVREVLQSLSPGDTISYAGLATTLNSSPRAVAGACRRNPVPVVVPCHRVVASNGPGGFSGAVDGKPLAVKQWLLEHERTACR